MYTRKLRPTLILATFALALVAFAASALAAPGDVTDPTVLRDLAAVREATAKYHDPAVAIADGYLATEHCSAGPTGAMGLHYFNPAIFGETLATGRIDPLRPMVLLYEPTPGGPKLVGVEYATLITLKDGSLWFGHEPPAPELRGPAPTLFGRPLDGPMAGHAPGEPAHYDLHAWIWEANPDGVFAQFNPNVRCPE